jgi:hypothetical protein
MRSSPGTGNHNAPLARSMTNGARKLHLSVARNEIDLVGRNASCQRAGRKESSKPILRYSTGNLRVLPGTLGVDRTARRE